MPPRKCSKPKNNSDWNSQSQNSNSNSEWCPSQSSYGTNSGSNSGTNSGSNASECSLVEDLAELKVNSPPNSPKAPQPQRKQNAKNALKPEELEDAMAIFRIMSNQKDKLNASNVTILRAVNKELRNVFPEPPEEDIFREILKRFINDIKKECNSLNATQRTQIFNKLKKLLKQLKNKEDLVAEVFFGEKSYTIVVPELSNKCVAHAVKLAIGRLGVTQEDVRGFLQYIKENDKSFFNSLGLSKCTRANGTVYFRIITGASTYT
jgi:hypothetical protein